MFLIKRLSLEPSPLKKFVSVSSVLRLKDPKNAGENQQPEKQESKQNSEHNVNKIENNKIKKEFKQKSKGTSSNVNNFNKVKGIQNVKANQASLKRSSEFNKKINDSINVVADELGGEVNKTKTELKNSIKAIHEVKEPKNINNKSWSSTGREKQGYTSPQQNRFQKNFESSNLFDPKTFKSPENELKKWNELQEKELKLMTTVPPRNYFEELIQWTDQGKIWHFPIDNDQGRDEEANNNFTDHVFLEEHLEPWCPKKGPLRHFMELITVGLSKNHTLTVKDKIEHILWYRDYFEKKKKLLSEIGAFSTKTQIEESTDLKKK